MQNTTTTITLKNQMQAKTGAPFFKIEIAVDQLLEALGESTKDTAKHSLETIEIVDNNIEEAFHAGRFE